MRAIYALIAAAVLILPALVHANTREPATLSSTQTFSFDPQGLIQLEQSYGDVDIQGWDRPEVEITTIRSTPRKPDNMGITAVKQGEDRLKITTDFPSRKSNSDLKYVIKAPAHARLVVHHDMGDVKVTNFMSDIEVTNRIGEIGLTLAEPESYSVEREGAHWRRVVRRRLQRWLQSHWTAIAYRGRQFAPAAFASNRHWRYQHSKNQMVMPIESRQIRMV